MSALASTGVGAPRSMAACSVQRPSPESDTRLLRSSSVGSCGGFASTSLARGADMIWSSTFASTGATVSPWILLGEVHALVAWKGLTARGILAFGFMGLFLGPTLLAVAYSLLSDWVAQKTPDNQAALDQLPPDKQA